MKEYFGFSSDLWAAIIGAIIGGIGSFGAQFYVLSIQNEKLCKSRLTSLMLKLIKMQHFMKRSYDSYQEALKKCNGDPSSVWTKFRSFSKIPDEIVILEEEMSELIFIKKKNYIMIYLC